MSDFKSTNSEMVNEGGDEALIDSSKCFLSAESIKIIAESVGFNSLPEDACKELAEEATFRLKRLLQNSKKFMIHSKRPKLLCEDVDLAIKLEGQEPLYGIQLSEPIPLRSSSGGGRDLHILEDKEISLAELTSNGLPKIPLGLSLRSHWLAIDGTQPSIPENPAAATKTRLMKESADPLSKLTHKLDSRENKLSAVRPSKLKNSETVLVRQLATHELSVEQQLYYKEITEACVGSDEGRRAEALQSLACDPGLHQMLPRLSTFISEGVRVNVVQHNLAILIYLMRMVKSLLENSTLLLEKYLHEIVPAVTTCIVSRKLCLRPDTDNHWALRDFASRLMCNICRNFNTSTNNLQTRVTRMFADVISGKNSRDSDLVSFYGAISGLHELGPDVVKVFILPYVLAIGARIDDTGSLEDRSINKIAVNHIRSTVVRALCTVIKTTMEPPDILEEYKKKFGVVLGPYLHTAVVRARQGGGSTPSVSSFANQTRISVGSGAFTASNVSSSTLNRNGSNIATAPVSSQRVNIALSGSK